MSQIDQLRQILVGDDARLLHELKERIENIEQRAKDVAEVLPDAIDDRVSAADGRLVNAFKKPVSLGLKQAIRDEPEAYGEILYPAMAPAIRRSIAQALSSMLITINKTLELATSSEGLKLRFKLRLESWKTGVPHAQLMMRESAQYKVEHVYLIDSATGLLIKEFHGLDVTSLDGDAVSAMFSAIQSFVQDSFAQKKGSRLTDFKSEHQLEHHNTWIIHGSSMMLACVILGDAPERLREKLYDTLDSIHVDYANQSADFDGDASIFDGVESQLAPLVALSEKSIEDEAPKRSKLKIFLPMFLFVCLLLTCFYSFDRYSDLTTVEHHLDQTPGLVVTGLYWRDGRIVVEGFKDPDANIPFATLSEEGISESLFDVHVVPFRSLEYGMELQRFKREFDLPSGLQFGGGSSGPVTLFGEASISWLNDNELRIRQLSADRRLDISALSASVLSIDSFVSKYLSEQDKVNVRFDMMMLSDRTVVKMTGRLSGGMAEKLNQAFLNSYWVDVEFIAE